jgi:hypothetical protein
MEYDRPLQLDPNLDTNQSNDRPISVSYHENAGSHAIARGNCYVGHPLRFDSILSFSNGQLHCSTRHDQHDTSPGNTTMLRQIFAGPALCLHCHTK